MSTASSPQDLQYLPLEEIEPNLSQPRRYFDEETLEELAGSIRERGVLQPVLVRPNADGSYQLIAGERRWRAAKLAGLQTIPALVSTYDDLAALEVGLIENMSREDLNPIEEARACVTLVRELGLTYRQIAARVGRDHVTVWNLMRLLDLSEEIIELMEMGKLTRTHGSALLMAKDPQVRSELAQEAIAQGWSVRTLEAHARATNSIVHGSASPGPSSAPSGSPPQRDGLEEVAMNVARVWGDALGAEVTVRTLPHRKLRVELVFDSPEGAFALGGQIAEKIARGSRRR